jgi:hypothetical protein
MPRQIERPAEPVLPAMSRELFSLLERITQFTIRVFSNLRFRAEAIDCARGLRACLAGNLGKEP